jgi:PEP-CTERM motif
VIGGGRLRRRGGIARERRVDGKQLRLDLAGPSVHEGDKLLGCAVLVTVVAYRLESIGQLYRDRADAENAFDELKNPWGLSGFTTQDINRSQTMARMRPANRGFRRAPPAAMVPSGQPSARETAMTSPCTVRLTAPLALLLVCGGASAQSNSEVYTYSVSRTEVSDSVTGSGAAQVERSEYDAVGGSRASVHYGASAASSQTLRASASLDIESQVSDNYAGAETLSSFRKIVTVGAGASGLAPGMKVLLDVPLSFDGRASTGSGTSGGTSFSYSRVDVSLSYSIVDLDQLIVRGGGEGSPVSTSPRELMRFGYGATLFYDSGTDANASAGWRGRSTNTAEIAGGDAEIYLDPAPSTGSIDLGVDTGALSFTIETYVGNRLYFEGSLGVFAQAVASYGPGYSRGFYSNTFDAGVTSTIAGLEFSGETPGVYPLTAVPEPASLLMTLAGLAALGLRIRARRATA